MDVLQFLRFVKTPCILFKPHNFIIYFISIDNHNIICMHGKKILIIGGTGSLGKALTAKYIEQNELYLYSRDESKHWTMQLEYNAHPNLHFIIGNINDERKIRQTLLRHNFHIVILAAALKHIDKCEYESNECISTNLLGTQIVLNEIEYQRAQLTQLESVCFVSTDKACSPVNIYGMTKAISEGLMVEKAKYIPDVKFVCVRYGNVLNSRGSIIPMLHKVGKCSLHSHFKLTDPRMTRFIMTLDQSVALIEHAIERGESGDIVIPKLVSCKIIDLLELFSEKYNKPIVVDKLRPGEKMLESLINPTQAMRLQTDDDGYHFIKPMYAPCCNALPSEHEGMEYSSTLNPMTKPDLKAFLVNLQLL
jgi:UDP-N-acetylglucosamine 4,6-dehydratase